MHLFAKDFIGRRLSNMQLDDKKEWRKAKKIFRDYSGSHYQMARDQVYNEYQSYSVPRMLEIEWAFELRDEYLIKFKEEVNDKKRYTYLNRLRMLLKEYHDSKGVYSMVEMVKNIIKDSDSFSKILMLEIILKTIQYMNISDKQLHIGEDAIQILKDICDTPIVVSKDFMQDGEIPEHMSDDVLIKRAQRDIEKWEEYLSPKEITTKSFWEKLFRI